MSAILRSNTFFSINLNACDWLNVEFQMQSSSRVEWLNCLSQTHRSNSMDDQEVSLLALWSEMAVKRINSAKTMRERCGYFCG